MKKLCIILILLVSCGTLFGQQENPNYPSRVTVLAQLQQAKLEAHNYKVLYKAADAKADSLIIHIYNIANEWRKLNNGIAATRLILQDAIDNKGGKIDFQKLIKLNWAITLPDSAATKPNDKAKKDKRR